MDFIFVSMPYAKFDSKWFGNVPNINLGILDALLTQEGRQVKTFHFHLEFLRYLKGFAPRVTENLKQLSGQFGVEFLSLDYVFASLLFEDLYAESTDRFAERLGGVGLTLDNFEELRQVAYSFVESSFSRISPYLEDAKLVGFSCSHYQLSGSLILCAKIKGTYPHIRTVVGGKDCSGQFGSHLLNCIGVVDFVGTGECEVTIKSLLEHIEDQKKPLCNVMYRNKEGVVMKAKSRPNLSLNVLPFPRYPFEEISISPSEVILPIELGRGCPWGKCTFCPDRSYNMQCRTKTAKRIAEEVEYYLAISVELNNFIILDSDAMKDPSVIIELSQYVAGKELSLHFGEFRAENIDKAVLEALLRLGNWASYFQVGIETFGDRLLGLMNKGVTALKNVEVIKLAAETKAPLQFNLFTSYPKMTMDDLAENLRVMDAIAHLLVQENILLFPGEFYLPTDCPVFLEVDHYGLRKSSESIFPDVFREFPMPSYSNYPYPYTFNNQEEQLEISQRIRKKVEEIKKKSPKDCFMHYHEADNELRVVVGLDGERQTHSLKSPEKDVYLAAVKNSRRVDSVSEDLGIPLAQVRCTLGDFEDKGLILYASDRQSFLALALESERPL